MATKPLMERAQAQAGEFQRPDIKALVPPEQADAVQRIVAAGMKLMYSPAMREELKAEVTRDAPVPQKMAQGVVGLLLTMDKQSKGGLPVAALMPATIELLGEAAETLIASGQAVTQEDYNEAVRIAIVLIAQALGAKDPQQVMDGLAQGMPPEGGAAPAGPVPPGEALPEEAPPEEPMPPKEEEIP